MSGIVVAGVDGSHNSQVALAWALREAADRGAAIRIVYVCPYQPADGVAQARNHGHLVLSGAKAYAGDVAPSVRVDRRLATGNATNELLSAAIGANLLVIGACGAQRPVTSPFGATVRDLAARARLPLAIVGRVPGRAHNRVVLGVDMRHPDSASTRHAFEAAQRTRGRLTLVYGSESAHENSDASGQDDDPELARKKQEAALNRFADMWSGRYPQTRIDHHMVVGMGDNALIAASRGADQLVIGGHRPQGLSHRTGHVAHNLLSYTACPVVIVPHRIQGDYAL